HLSLVPGQQKLEGARVPLTVRVHELLVGFVAHRRPGARGPSPATLTPCGNRRTWAALDLAHRGIMLTTRISVAWLTRWSNPTTSGARRCRPTSSGCSARKAPSEPSRAPTGTRTTTRCTCARRTA